MIIYSLVLHTLDYTDNVPRFYCTPSIVLIMCLDCTTHSRLYYTLSIVLHTLDCTLAFQKLIQLRKEPQESKPLFNSIRRTTSGSWSDQCSNTIGYILYRSSNKLQNCKPRLEHGRTDNSQSEFG